MGDFLRGHMKKLIVVFLLLAAILLCGCAEETNQSNSDQLPPAGSADLPPQRGGQKPTAYEPAQFDPSGQAPMVYSSGPTPVPVMSTPIPSTQPDITARPHASGPATPAPTEIPNPLILDLTSGKNADCFAGLKSEFLSVGVQSKIEPATYTFEGVFLSKVLEKFGITTYKKIEVVANDAVGTVDITDHMRNGDVLLAWRESKNGGSFITETPIRICPKNATLAQQLVKQIMRVVITR